MDRNRHIDGQTNRQTNRHPVNDLISSYFSICHQIGGMKAGTFEPYPTYSSDPYIKNPAKRIMGDEKKKIFTPPAVPKSRPTKSIVAQNVVRCV